MMVKSKYPVEMAVTFVWIGFVSAISFMEAPLKFQAPGVTTGMGLSIGRLVFGFMNKMEWVLAVTIIGTFLFSKENRNFSLTLLFLIPLTILIIQTAWLLPELDARAELIINGNELPPSNLHFYYMSSEVIKIVCLFSFGITLFK